MKEKTVKVEQAGHVSNVKATVTEGGKTGEATDTKVEKAIDKAKEQSKATGGR
jgi:hypothetical protein